MLFSSFPSFYFSLFSPLILQFSNFLHFQFFAFSIFCIFSFFRFIQFNSNTANCILSLIMAKEDEELNEIWSLFKDSPEEYKERRRQITKTIQNEATGFPTQMSIITAFDELLLCFAIGGQLKNYYRYGTYSNCQEQREKFWFSMRHGSFFESDEPLDELIPKQLEKRQKIADFYKKRLMATKARGSSEDVWDLRKKKLDKPFREE